MDDERMCSEERKGKLSNVLLQISSCSTYYFMVVYSWCFLKIQLFLRSLTSSIQIRIPSVVVLFWFPFPTHEQVPVDRYTHKHSPDESAPPPVIPAYSGGFAGQKEFRCWLPLDTPTAAPDAQPAGEERRANELKALESGVRECLCLCRLFLCVGERVLVVVVDPTLSRSS